jgi:squalene-hopene/tetraprenyl-beta-curcumene cyclase
LFQAKNEHPGFLADDNRLTRTMTDLQRLTAAYEQAKADLLAERVPAGHWVGELATSSLATATAVSALSIVASNAGSAGLHGREDTGIASATQENYRRLITGGVQYLTTHQNDDGGWGDTDKSFSNISTTMLVVAALHLAQSADEFPQLIARARHYIDARGGIPGLRKRYGKDKTFAVPILTNYALAGLVPWSEVSPLPFELACLPQKFYRFVRLPVVSYAIPALVAIGQARYFHLPPWNPLMRIVRGAAVRKSLDVLRQMQPASGGYLEAVTLTSFVVMSLASIGRADHAVTQSGVNFLLESVRPDGSWPIDTNLATWNTTLAINALLAVNDQENSDQEKADQSSVASAGQNGAGRDSRATGGSGPELDFSVSPQLLDWLLSCQHRERHPFTGADPGGWGWSDLSGAVPDADDTPGALLALAKIAGAPNCDAEQRARIESAARMGLTWLLDLQNSDGGWPTFCRGWGTLPFDRSGADLTAHAIRAVQAWRKLAAEPAFQHMQSAMERGFQYLAKQQRADGSWLPLWFGNQCYPDDENPVYGTAKVLAAYRDCGNFDLPAQRGCAWLESHQNRDGGWGNAAGNAEETRSSVEETALALEALITVAKNPSQSVIYQGLDWVYRTVETRQHKNSSPIGFYFAKLWYYEKLYPLTFTVSALGQALRTLARTSPRQTATSPE